MKKNNNLSLTVYMFCIIPNHNYIKLKNVILSSPTSPAVPDVYSDTYWMSETSTG